MSDAETKQIEGVLSDIMEAAGDESLPEAERINRVHEYMKKKFIEQEGAELGTILADSLREISQGLNDDFDTVITKTATVLMMQEKFGYGVEPLQDARNTHKG